MNIVKPYFEIETVDGLEMLRKIEKAGRTCYKSEDKITDGSAAKFVAGILKRGHESVIEHGSVSVRIICDRGVTHEIVRHRLASYSQESTRYCDYSKGKHGAEITYIKPTFQLEDDDEKLLRMIEQHYFKKISQGKKPQEARYFLPNGLKTEIVMTCNLREWRHFFKLRTAPAAHPQMREIAVPMLKEFKLLIPVIFDDIE